MLEGIIIVGIIILGAIGLKVWEKRHHQKVCLPAGECNCESFFGGSRIPKG